MYVAPLTKNSSELITNNMQGTKSQTEERIVDQLCTGPYILGDLSELTVILEILAGGGRQNAFLALFEME